AADDQDVVARSEDTLDGCPVLDQKEILGDRGQGEIAQGLQDEQEVRRGQGDNRGQPTFKTFHAQGGPMGADWCPASCPSSSQESKQRTYGGLKHVKTSRERRTKKQHERNKLQALRFIEATFACFPTGGRSSRAMSGMAARTTRQTDQVRGSGQCTC